MPLIPDRYARSCLPRHSVRCKLPWPNRSHQTDTPGTSKASMPPKPRQRRRTKCIDTGLKHDTADRCDRILKSHRNTHFTEDTDVFAMQFPFSRLHFQDRELCLYTPQRQYHGKCLCKQCRKSRLPRTPSFKTVTDRISNPIFATAAISRKISGDLESPRERMIPVRRL